MNNTSIDNRRSFGVTYAAVVSSSGGDQAVNPKVRLVVRFAEDNLHRDLYVDEVAQLVRLSRSRFCDLFKSELQMSFTQFLKKKRLEKGRLLLETSFESIKSIAFQIGYNDPTRFERDFKKAYGSTPSELRTEYLAQLNGPDMHQQKKQEN